AWRARADGSSRCARSTRRWRSPGWRTSTRAPPSPRWSSSSAWRSWIGRTPTTCSRSTRRRTCCGRRRASAQSVSRSAQSGGDRALTALELGDEVAELLLLAQGEGGEGDRAVAERGAADDLAAAAERLAV